MRNRLKWQLRECNRKRCLQKPFQIFFKTEGETQNFDKRLKNSRKTQGFGKSTTCAKIGRKKVRLETSKRFYGCKHGGVNQSGQKKYLLIIPTMQFFIAGH